MYTKEFEGEKGRMFCFFCTGEPFKGVCTLLAFFDQKASTVKHNKPTLYISYECIVMDHDLSVLTQPDISKQILQFLCRFINYINDIINFVNTTHSPSSLMCRQVRSSPCPWVWTRASASHVNPLPQCTTLAVGYWEEPRPTSSHTPMPSR